MSPLSATSLASPVLFDELARLDFSFLLVHQLASSEVE
jgi:hypothetical protein